MHLESRWVSSLKSMGNHLYPSALSLALVFALTALTLSFEAPALSLHSITTVFFVPVLISATRWGIVPAIITAIASVCSLEFFFYPPKFKFHVYEPEQVVDLVVFLLIALLISQLAGKLRQQAKQASRRELETKHLYAFSRKLAVANSASEIYDAIQTHLSSAVQRKVILLGSDLAADDRLIEVPPQVRFEAADMLARKGRSSEEIILDGVGTNWLIRTIASGSVEFSAIAIDLGHGPRSSIETAKHQVQSALAQVVEVLQRLSVGRVIHEAKLRADADRLREALIGSISHDLRTPLTSIVCSATILGTVPAVAGDARLLGLVNDICDEAERHNNDIQNLLDASRIGITGVQPRAEWSDLADVVNTAVDRIRRRHAEREIIIELPDDLPLVFLDPVLLKQAMVQVLDNAAKYSAPNSPIKVSARKNSTAVVLTVSDQGAGLTDDEKAGLFAKFYRGERHVSSVAGSGLGLWIAQAFVAANGGKIEAHSAGAERGTTMMIHLPNNRAAPASGPESGDAADD